MEKVSADNICLIAYTIYENDPRVRRYAESLASAGHRVDVLALRRHRGESRHSRLNGVHVYRILIRDFEEKGPLGYFLRIFLYFLVGGAVLAYRHLRHRYRVVHVNNIPDYLVFMAALPKWTGARVVLDIHDILPELFCEKFGFDMDSFAARLLLWVERISVRFAHQVIVANDLWRMRLIERDRLDPRACITLLNYPSRRYLERRPVHPDGGGLTLIYPGTISYLHGVDLAVRSLSMVRRELPDVQLHIYGRAGSAAYLRSVQDLIRELDLERNVHLHEPVPSEELRRIYRNADIGIVPKRAGIFSQEAFSTKIFDYLAVGLPIIASRTKVDVYYFDDSMILFFRPDDHEDLARCILELHRNPPLRRALVESGQRFVERNTWEVKRGLYHEFIGVNGIVEAAR
jgi:glycosyltransferase involved in cell wall biosynthesis